MHEPITRERLERYTDNCKRLSELLNDKKRLEKCLGLSGVDYSKTRVTSGNSNKLTEEERYTMRLERKNKEIAELRAEIEPEHRIIVNQICRLKKSKWRTIITLKYIEHYNTYALVDYLFAEDPKWNPEKEPIEEYKKSQEYENYRRSYNKLLEEAIKELEKISGKAFTPARELYKQLYLEV